MSAGEVYVKRYITRPVRQERIAGPVFGCRFRREERVRGWWEVEGRGAGVV